MTMPTLYRIPLQQTIVPLLAAAYFLSQAFNVESYNHIRGLVSSDQAGTLTVEHSYDNTGNGSYFAVTSMSLVAGVPAKFDEICYGIWARVRFVNGAINQGTFVLSITGDPFK